MKESAEKMVNSDDSDKEMSFNSEEGLATNKCETGKYVRLSLKPGTSTESNPAADSVKKKKKHGIIYISSIPKYMNVTRLKEILSEYGPVGRVYLQPAPIHFDKKGSDKKKQKKNIGIRRFTEGWVEFKSKRVAKLLAVRLNGKPISTRKKSKFCDILWNLKYLPRFKWVHLSERLTYEKAVHKQRLKTEISQARKEATFFGTNLDKSEIVKKKAIKNKNKLEC